MLVLMLGGVDDNLPNFSHSFLGDHGWKDLDEYLGQDEGYSAERYRNQRETVVSRKTVKLISSGLALVRRSERCSYSMKTT